VGTEEAKILEVVRAVQAVRLDMVDMRDLLLAAGAQCVNVNAEVVHCPSELDHYAAVLGDVTRGAVGT
jgi:hypothetical protein